MNPIKIISDFRNNRMNYLNRYLAFVILYFINDLITGNYETGSLGFIATFGGIIFAPLMFILMYFFAGAIGFWVNLSYINSGFNNWLKEWHSFNMSLGTFFYDIWLVILVYSLFTGGDVWTSY